MQMVFFHDEISSIQPLFFIANAHFFVHFTVKLLDSSLSLLSHMLISNSLLKTFRFWPHLSAATTNYKIPQTATPSYSFSAFRKQ